MKHFAGAADEGGMGGGVALETIHHPRCGISQIAIDTEKTGLLGVRAFRLAGYVIVRWADQRAFQFDDAGRHGVVKGGDGLQAGDGGVLVWR